jgi:DNA-binding response OmpR family regulator
MRTPGGDQNRRRTLIRAVLSELLRDAGDGVATAENGHTGRAVLEASPVHVILLVFVPVSSKIPHSPTSP